MAIVAVPAGCGKTTLLNIVAGLLPLRRGKRFDLSKRSRAPASTDAVVFQHASLLPWRTVTATSIYGWKAKAFRIGRR